MSIPHSEYLLTLLKNIRSAFPKLVKTPTLRFDTLFQAVNGMLWVIQYSVFYDKLISQKYICFQQYSFLYFGMRDTSKVNYSFGPECNTHDSFGYYFLLCGINAHIYVYFSSA